MKTKTKIIRKSRFLFEPFLPKDRNFPVWSTYIIMLVYITLQAEHSLGFS